MRRLIIGLFDLLGVWLFLHKARVLGAEHALNLGEFTSLVGFSLKERVEEIGIVPFY